MAILIQHKKYFNMGEVHTLASSKVNEVVNFLDKYSKDKIKSLKSAYPEHQDILKGGILQGDEPEFNFSELVVKATICLEGMKEVILQCKEEKPKIKGRLKRLSNIQLITQILIAISGASIVTTLSNKVDSRFSIYAATCAFLGSLLTIYIQFKSGIFGQNGKNVFQLYDNLVSNSLKAEANQRDLEFLIKINNQNMSSKLDSLITECNGLCYDTRKFLEDLK